VGNAFTSLQADTTDSGNTHTHTIRYCILDASMSGTNTVTSSGNQTSQTIVLVIAKDTYTGTPEAGTPFVQNIADNVVDPPPLTPTWGSADTLWIVSVGQDGAGRPEPGRTATDASWNLSSIYFSAGSTVVAAGMFFHFETAGALDPATGIIILQTVNEHSENTIAVKGQAIPASGTPKPPCVLSAIERISCQAVEELPR
jgi:hypothetical protein